MNNKTLIITERSNITAIADAVRSKTNTTVEMTLGDIANSIYNIESSGSGTSIETCKVSITAESSATGITPGYVTYTTVEDKKLVNKVLKGQDIEFKGPTIGIPTLVTTVTIICAIGTNIYIDPGDYLNMEYVTSDNITLKDTLGLFNVCEFIVNGGPTATIESVR